ncbi:MAG: class I SAM-dependent methyltransferase [Bacteroidota bacterium]
MKINICLLFILFITLSCQDNTPISSPFDNQEQQQEEASEDTNIDSEGAGIKEEYINTNRVIWQKPEMILNMLGNLDQKVVADLGCGESGYFSRRFAQKAMKVIALDVDPVALAHLDSIRKFQIPEEIQSRIELRTTPEDLPNLEEEETDIVFISNTYIYLPDRISYLNTLRTKLKAGGRVMIIDFKKKRTPFGPPSQIRVPLYRVEQELEEAGFSTVQTNDTALDYQYIVIAYK